MKFARLSHLAIALTLIALSVSVFSNISVSRAAVGVSPPWVKNDHMLPGTTFEQIINLSRSDSEEAIKAEVKISGDKEIIKWITVLNKNKLIMKKGQNILPMRITVDVPKRASLKNYTGNIFISLSPLAEREKLGGGQVSISIGANVSIDIDVIGKKIFDYKIKSITVDPLQEGSPFSLNVKMENLGNVDIKNANGQIDIYDSTQTEIVKSLDFITLSETITPNKTKVSKMIFEDTILDPGEYWVLITTFKDGKVMYETRLFQEVKAKVIPVITPEYGSSQNPSLPKIPGESDVIAEPPAIQVPVSNLIPVAPVAEEANKMYLILGLAGLGFGLIAIIGLIIVLIIVLKNQQRTAIGSYNNVDENK